MVDMQGKDIGERRYWEFGKDDNIPTLAATNLYLVTEVIAANFK